MSDELKPCAHCGKKAYTIQSKNTYTGVDMVSCDYCGSRMYGNNIPSAIAAWNRRPTAQPDYEKVVSDWWIDHGMAGYYGHEVAADLITRLKSEALAEPVVKESLTTQPAESVNAELVEALKIAEKALGDLSYECFDINRTTVPSIETYNRAFADLTAIRSALAKFEIKGERKTVDRVKFAAGSNEIDLENFPQSNNEKS